MKLILKLIIVVLVLPGAILSENENINAEQIALKTPIYEPTLSNFTPALGTYEYRVSWQGIPAATVYFHVDKIGLSYLFTTKVKTYKGIDIFYRLRYNAQGTVSAVNLLPIESYFYQEENSRTKTTRIKFSPDGTITAVRSKNDEPEEKTQFNTDNFTLDPFSAGFIARSLDWQKGQTREFDTYNGRSRYLIKLSAIDKTQIKVNNTTRDAWIISPVVKKLGTDKPSKLRRAKIFITKDKAREILQIHSEVFIGTVKTKLVAFTPSPKNETTEVALSMNGKILLK